MFPSAPFCQFARGWRVELPGCGVLTAADAAYFPGLLMLLATIRQRVPCTVVDLGLTAYQRLIIEAHGAAMVRCPRYPALPAAHRTSWLKPHWLGMSPYERTLWVDADALVCGDLTPLFERIAGGPLVMAHPYGIQAPRPCAPATARLLGSAELPPRTDAVNAGVLGLDRGPAALELLGLWAALVDRCLADERTRAHVQFWDEGCLHLAVQQLRGQAWIVRDRPGWDRFFYLERADTPTEFWELLPMQDGDTIMHMIGKCKPWLRWGTWVDESKMDTPQARRKAALADKKMK